MTGLIAFAIAGASLYFANLCEEANERSAAWVCLLIGTVFLVFTHAVLT